MRAGKLRDRVTFQAPTQSTGDGGQPTVTWADHRTVWADVHPKSMKELVRDQQPTAQTEWIVETRYDSTLTQQMRIVHDSQTLNIIGWTCDKRKRWMFWKCKEAE